MNAADQSTSEIRITGISASPGICIGKAYMVDTEGVEVVNTYRLAPGELEDEKNRFKSAVKKARDQLDDIIDNTPEAHRQQNQILETHKVLLRDKMLFNRTLDRISEEGINAEWALKKVVADIKNTFTDIENSYVRERANDIVQVSEHVFRNLSGAGDVRIAEIRKRVILVARDLSPAETSQIDLERIRGFITDRGGKSSHTSIIARALEIPAVQGLHNATRLIRNDDLIIVDGSAGLVIVNPSESTLIAFEEKRIAYEERKAAIGRSSHLEARTTDGVHVHVMANIELPEEVVSAHSYGSDGIGLYRTEFQYMSISGFPSEEALFDKYKDVVDVMAGKPVTIRTLDINGDKAVSYGTDTFEENPALGLRAIRYCLKKTDVFRTQLRAILRAAAFGNVRILFPMISSKEEIEAAVELLDTVAAELAAEGLKFKREIPIGAMIEVPSAVIMADALADIVDFFSLGTNDLVQYTLAIDRGNQEVAHLFQPLHPAILRMVKHVATVAREKGVKTYICGEMAGDPLNVPILIGLGLEEFSMNPQSIPAVKSMIREVDTESCARFLDKVLQLTAVREINTLVESTYGPILQERIYGA
ncbi:MAG: phosphoenolpyruvate--protein phosphotransferase [Pseudomonadota bacterium]